MLFMTLFLKPARGVHQVLTFLKLEKHPEKTFVGKIERNLGRFENA